MTRRIRHGFDMSNTSFKAIHFMQIRAQTDSLGCDQKQSDKPTRSMTLTKCIEHHSLFFDLDEYQKIAAGAPRQGFS
jgi:hypothetical protein